MDHSQILGNSGSKYTIYWPEKKLTLSFSYISDIQRSWYEQWMKQSYLEALETDTTLSESRKVQQRDRFYSRVRAGEFRYGKEEFNRVKDTELGQIKFFQMLLIDNHKDITQEDVEQLLNDQPEKMSVVFALIMVESSAVWTRASNSQREQMLHETYQKLTLPVEAGGLNIPLAIVAELTDKQKQALLTKEINKASYIPPSDEQKADMNKIVDDFFARAKAKGVEVID